MRFILLSLVPLLAAAAVPPTSTTAQHAHGKFVASSGPVPKSCRGRIETVRQERGLPKLDSGKNGSNHPLLILAVDRSIDGCEVLVIANNIDDIRPLPEFSDTARLRPAH
jgi:hypothetical protein